MIMIYKINGRGDKPKNRPGNVGAGHPGVSFMLAGVSLPPLMVKVAFSPARKANGAVKAAS
jgi:hypothetical protein